MQFLLLCLNEWLIDCFVRCLITNDTFDWLRTRPGHADRSRHADAEAGEKVRADPGTTTAWIQGVKHAGFVSDDDLLAAAMTTEPQTIHSTSQDGNMHRLLRHQS